MTGPGFKQDTDNSTSCAMDEELIRRKEKQQQQQQHRVLDQVKPEPGAFFLLTFSTAVLPLITPASIKRGAYISQALNMCQGMYKRFCLILVSPHVRYALLLSTFSI